MSEPFWTPLGGQPVDWEGAWAAGTQYAPGDVVTYNGISYLAVNPSLGSPPSIVVGASLVGTSLPVSPFDGQEFILVDSLTAPTYSWRFLYVAAKATNKWVFIGGAPAFSEVAAAEASGSTSYAALGTAGPAIAVPVAGLYVVSIGFTGHNSSSITNYQVMSYDIGATPASDNDYVGTGDVQFTPGSPWSVSRKMQKTLTALTLTAKYKLQNGNSLTFSRRWMEVTPMAVGG
jgi:hypothetical protein